MLVFQGEELGGTAPGRGEEMGELESAGVSRLKGLGGGRAGARWREWQCSAAHLYSPVSCVGRMGCLRPGRLC